MIYFVIKNHHKAKYKAFVRIIFQWGCNWIKRSIVTLAGNCYNEIDVKTVKPTPAAAGRAALVMSAAGTVVHTLTFSESN